MNLDTYLLFVVTTGLICLSPGPAALLVVARSTSAGFAAASWSIAGITLANILYFILSATGLASLIMASDMLFNLIKWLGVIYLAGLGISLLGSQNHNALPVHNTLYMKQGYRALQHGLLVELCNPKALLYFIALLPQFIDVNRPVVPQLFIYGITTLFLDLFAYGSYAWLADTTRQLARGTTWLTTINRLAGGLLILAGLRMVTVSV